MFFTWQEAQNRPAGASVPALGLSNKAVYSGEVEKIQQDKQIQVHPNDQYLEVYFTPISLQSMCHKSQFHILYFTVTNLIFQVIKSYISVSIICNIDFGVSCIFCNVKC
jgi:elongator complex protein 2